MYYYRLWANFNWPVVKYQFKVNNKDTPSTLSMELALSRWGGLFIKQFQPECVNEESSTERRSYSREANRYSQPCQDLSQHLLDKIRKAFCSSGTPLGVVTVRLYVGSPLSDWPPLCCGRTAPEVSEVEGSYA